MNLNETRMPVALRPSELLSDKRNVIPSIDRSTEVTAEDFQEISSILNDHAQRIDAINKVDGQSKFYGFFTTFDLLKSQFPVAEEDGFAVIDPLDGNPQKIATFKLGAWTIEEVKAPIKFYANRAGRPLQGEQGVWYVVKDEKIAYLWYDGKYNGFGQDGANGLSAYELAVAVKAFEGTLEQWLESLQGKSNYQIALDNGFVGTEAEWLESIKGADGESAYEIAAANGFQGTEAEWIASIQGVEGKSAYEVAIANGFQGTEAEWIASLEGPQGKSAYQVALDNGFIGTEAEWLASLEGADGDPGSSAYEVAVANGFLGTEAEWLASIKGADGESAYEIAVANGFQGSEAEWIASIQGVEGKSAYEVALANGFQGTEAEWIISLQGPQGKSAYQIALDNGFIGTEAEWSASLEGADGDPGSSAYEVAVANGFLGTEAEWLASLEGADGDPGSSAYEVAVANGFVGTEVEWLASLEGADGDPGAGFENIPAEAGKIPRTLADGTIEWIDEPLGSSTPEPSQVSVTSSASFTSENAADGGYSQDGKNVLIKNGSSPVNLTITSPDNFISSYQKEGTGAITFLAGPGMTLRQVDGTNILSGSIGSTATVSVVGTVVSLRVSNA